MSTPTWIHSIKRGAAEVGILRIGPARDNAYMIDLFHCPPALLRRDTEDLIAALREAWAWIDARGGQAVRRDYPDAYLDHLRRRGLPLPEGAGTVSVRVLEAPPRRRRPEPLGPTDG